MTGPALTIGAGLIAFGPLIAIFSGVVYNKAQLVIVVTTAAFFFLIGSLFASLFWWVFHTIGLNGPLAAIIPGVIAQFMSRCLFVALYHRIEKVIQLSLQNNDTNAESNDPNEPSNRDGDRHKNWTEAAKLRLQLNDAACGIAAGVGFGGMHAILLYGTLLASETLNNVGVLYQDSCPVMPSLAVSAIHAFCFSIMDIFWMLFTFFGMRRRSLFHRGETADDTDGRPGAWLGNSRSGGNLALFWVLATHFVASIFTVADFFPYGCVVSIPALLVLVLVVAYLFWAGVGRIYMPPDQLFGQESRGDHYNSHED